MSYGEHLAYLRQLGAGATDHTKNSLLEHLEGTYTLLKAWDSREPLCLAGLYHAMYSTHGFASALMDSNNRDQLRSVIGDEAESIVYTFCACDRESFYPQIGRVEHPIFHNRFTDQKSELEPAMLRDLLELTMANELQIALDETHIVGAKQRLGKTLRSMKLLPPKKLPFAEFFERCTPYVSAAAHQCFMETYGRK